MVGEKKYISLPTFNLNLIEPRVARRLLGDAILCGKVNWNIINVSKKKVVDLACAVLQSLFVVKNFYLQNRGGLWLFRQKSRGHLSCSVFVVGSGGNPPPNCEDTCTQQVDMRTGTISELWVSRCHQFINCPLRLTRSLLKLGAEWVKQRNVNP